MLMQRRLIRDNSFGLTAKLWQVSYIYMGLLCALAGVGYVALYSAAGGSPEPYATRHILRFVFGLGLMLCIAMVDIRFIAKLSWPLYFISLALLVLVLRMGMWARARKGGSSWVGCSCSRAS